MLPFSVVLVETLGDTLVKELAGIVKFPNHRALVSYYDMENGNQVSNG